IIGSEHVMVDHVSASWSMDETLSVTKSAHVTVQHSIIAESLDDSYHPEGAHGYGSLVRGTGERGYTFWRNLWAHHERRSPGFGGQQDPPPPGEPGQGLDLDLVNNVIYDWGLLPSHTLSEPYQLRVNLEGNTYVRGPSSVVPFVLFNIEATADELTVHRSGNVFDDDVDGMFDPEPMVDADAFGAVTWAPDRFEFDRRQPRVLAAERAYHRVLQSAGASKDRDAVDARIVHQVRTQTGGLIDSQDDVGGWSIEPSRARAPRDRDADGMSDRWERRRGLDPDDASDRNGHDLHRRLTNLEIYLAKLAR
ncbi:MAG: pectate lyase, partial [Acidimicrobiia bacterium]|nr:pectate lyase [Acidimicrobiia bacterium]